ncbi:helix-turn-helix domain-containing protein [Salipaludibacillus neizhouensis]|nr:helix-turn-helix transcriptional regulator [Salipaludibacillus neizhouensis]
MHNTIYTYKDVSSDVSRKLFDLRKSHNLSQRQIAKAIGHNQSHINMLETGKRELTLETLYKFAVFYDVSMSDLLAITNKTSTVTEEPSEMQKLINEPSVRNLLTKATLEELKLLARIYLSSRNVAIE